MFNLDFVQVQQFPSLASQQVNKMVDLYNAQYRRSGWLVLSIQPSNIFFDKNISILMTELHTFIFNHWSSFLQNWPFLVKTIKKLLLEKITSVFLNLTIADSHPSNLSRIWESLGITGRWNGNKRNHFALMLVNVKQLSKV